MDLGVFPEVMETKKSLPNLKLNKTSTITWPRPLPLIHFQYLNHRLSISLHPLASDTAAAFEHPQAKYGFLYTNERYVYVVLYD